MDKKNKIFGIDKKLNVLDFNPPKWVFTCIKIGAIIGLIVGIYAGIIISINM
jgi:hypothetical protein